MVAQFLEGLFSALMDFDWFNPSNLRVNWACSVSIRWSCLVDFQCPLLVVGRKTW
jgi:hypothetical protein